MTHDHPTQDERHRATMRDRYGLRPLAPLGRPPRDLPAWLWQHRDVLDHARRWRDSEGRVVWTLEPYVPPATLPGLINVREAGRHHGYRVQIAAYSPWTPEDVRGSVLLLIRPWERSDRPTRRAGVMWTPADPNRISEEEHTVTEHQLDQHSEPIPADDPRIADWAADYLAKYGEHNQRTEEVVNVLYVDSSEGEPAGVIQRSVPMISGNPSTGTPSGVVWESTGESTLNVEHEEEE